MLVSLGSVYSFFTFHLDISMLLRFFGSVIKIEWWCNVLLIGGSYVDLKLCLDATRILKIRIKDLESQHQGS